MVTIRPHRVRDREGCEARRNSATGGSGIRDADGRCRVGRGKREADYLRPDWTDSTCHFRWGRGQLRGLPSRQDEDGLEILGSRIWYACPLKIGHYPWPQKFVQARMSVVYFDAESAHHPAQGEEGGRKHDESQVQPP